MIRFTTLPNTIYTVKVPLLATLDEYDMLSGELPYKEGTDGNRIQQHHDMTVVGMTIDRMLEVYSNGFPIRIMNKSDLFEIYNTLKRYYLDADKDNLLSINQRAHDDERIPDIKKFLQEILSNNEHLLTAEEKRNSLKAIMERTLVGNIITLDETEKEKLKQNIEVEKTTKPVYNPTVEQSTFLGNMLVINKIPKHKKEEQKIIRREI